MILREDGLNHIVTSNKYDERAYCAIVTIVSEDTIREEIRWARGHKVIRDEDVKMPQSGST